MPYTPSQPHPLQTKYEITFYGGSGSYVGVVFGNATVAVLGENIVDPGTPDGAVAHTDDVVQAIVDALSAIPGLTASAYKTTYETQSATATPAP